MALMNCPECKIEVSDKAASCPKCGCPIANPLSLPPSAGKGKSEVKARSGVMDGVKLGCGMFIILPLILPGLVLLFF